MNDPGRLERLVESDSREVEITVYGNEKRLRVEAPLAEYFGGHMILSFTPVTGLAILNDAMYSVYNKIGSVNCINLRQLAVEVSAMMFPVNYYKAITCFP